MARSIEAFKKDLGKIRTGRASFSLLDGIKVDYYGTPTPLQQVGTLSVPESRLITITPWDAKMVGPIEKAIQGSNLGLNPSSDGKVVRIPIPPLTEERRKDLVKVVRKMAEDARISVRNIRRDSIDRIKEREKKKEISEDEMKRYQDRVQKETDNYVKKIDEILKTKEQEIMEV
ncbi:MAG: ribosome recycling factor [Deltaproteobacteria bacterium]|nr:ribosome recycling factor [Deltaproteobacteria bacterium]NNG47844.1 ribosome recycling factor [Deltaproteobacteria bacterium]